MEMFIDPDELRALLEIAGQGMLVMVLSMPIGAIFLGMALKGRRGTFVLLTTVMYLMFCIGFYGFDVFGHFVLEWDYELGDPVVRGIGLIIGLVLLAASWWVLRIYFNDAPSILENEFNNLPDAMMSPMDRRRKANMERGRTVRYK